MHRLPHTVNRPAHWSTTPRTYVDGGVASTLITQPSASSPTAIAYLFLTTASSILGRHFWTCPHVAPDRIPLFPPLATQQPSPLAHTVSLRLSALHAIAASGNGSLAVLQRISSITSSCYNISWPPPARLPTYPPRVLTSCLLHPIHYPEDTYLEF